VGFNQPLKVPSFTEVLERRRLAAEGIQGIKMADIDVTRDLYTIKFDCGGSTDLCYSNTFNVKITDW